MKIKLLDDTDTIAREGAGIIAAEARDAVITPIPAGRIYGDHALVLADHATASPTS